MQLNQQCSEEEVLKCTFEFLMKKYHKQVRKLAYFYVRDKYYAEDITQEVFYKVYKNLNKFKGNSTYYTWIYKIAINQCKDFLKSSYHKKIIFLENFNKEIIDIRTQHRFEEIESNDVIKYVLELPIKLKEVILLYYFNELTTIEIADILDIGENTVRTRLCRARKKLQKILSKEESC